MRRKRLLGLIIVTIILIVIAIVILVARYNVYELTPKVCSVMLGLETTPESFVEDDASGTRLKNRYTCAWVNEDGNLVLILTNDQRDEWRNSDEGLQILHTILGDNSTLNIQFEKPSKGLEKTMFDGAVSCGLELSEDYTQIVEEPGEASIYSPWFIHMSVAMQLFEGVPSEDIEVEYIQCDANGNVVNRFFVWSQNSQTSPLP